MKMTMKHGALALALLGSAALFAGRSRIPFMMKAILVAGT